MTICGLILAGGRSSRFGREKAVALLGGEPLIAWVSRVLASGASPVGVNAPLGSAAAQFAKARGLPVIADLMGSDAGPLAGIRAGLAWARAQGAGWLATAPCDTPLLPQDLVRRLALGRSKGGAIARTKDGLQPLCAIWPVSALAEVETLDGHPPVREVLARLGAAHVAFEDDALFANLNTPEEFRRAEARLAPS